jgi:hypothetical protein
MKPLSAIRQDVEFETLDLVRELEAIHPKMNKTLEHDDFNDPSLYDDNLKTQFEIFKKKVQEVNLKYWSQALEYFNIIIHDLMDSGVDVGYHSDGSDVYNNFKVQEFEPSIHTTKLYSSVMEYKNSIHFIPFWQRTSTVLNKDTDKWVNITPGVNPTSYIKYGLHALKERKLTRTEELIIAVRTEMNCGYKMHSTKHGFNKLLDKDVQEYINNIQEHKLLEELLTREPGSYNVRLYNYKDDGIVVHLKEDTDAN